MKISKKNIPEYTITLTDEEVDDFFRIEEWAENTIHTLPQTVDKIISALIDLRREK